MSKQEAKGYKRKRRQVVSLVLLDSSSSTSESEEEEGWWEDKQVSIPQNVTSSLCGIRTITGIDPGTKNFSLYQYDIEQDAMRSWVWGDIHGLGRSKITSKQVIKRVGQLITDFPEYFASDLILIEGQMVINTKHFRMQLFLEKKFAGKCKVISPKKTKKGIFELLGAEDSMEITGHTSEETMTYSQKKNFGIKVGTVIMNAAERRMYSLINKDRSEWKAAITNYDKRLINQGRTKAKKPRTVKVRPDDAFDSMLLTLEEACRLTGKNIIHRRVHWRRYCTKT